MNNPELEKRVAHRLEATTGAGAAAPTQAPAAKGGAFDTWALVDAEVSARVPSQFRAA